MSKGQAPTPAPDGIKLSLCLWSAAASKELEAAAIIELAKVLGYDSVELAPETLWPLIRNQGLSIAAINGHSSIESGLGHTENSDRIERELRENISKASAEAIANLICFSGNRRPGEAASSVDVAAATLHRVAGLAEREGVTLVIELLNSKRDHPAYEFDHMDWGVAVCKKVGSANIKVLYDVYHAQVMEGDLVATIQSNSDHIGHYHIAGNPGRHEPDAAQEINYPAVLEAIVATGYRGYVGHEYVPTKPLLRSLGDSVSMSRTALGHVADRRTR